MPERSRLPDRSGPAARPEGSFADVVVAHRAAVFRYAMTIVRNEALAEDVLQDTFLSAFRAWSSFRGDAKVRTWLLSIAKHAALRRLRRRAGEPAVFDDLASLGASAGWGEAPLPDDALARREQRDTLQRALDALPDVDREVIVLRDLEELSGAETARVLGISEAAVRSRLHRARLKFLAALRRGGPHGD